METHQCSVLIIKVVHERESGGNTARGMTQKCVMYVYCIVLDTKMLIKRGKDKLHLVFREQRTCKLAWNKSFFHVLKTIIT